MNLLLCKSISMNNTCISTLLTDVVSTCVCLTTLHLVLQNSRRRSALEAVWVVLGPQALWICEAQWVRPWLREDDPFRTGLDNIRDVIPFPRYPGRADLWRVDDFRLKTEVNPALHCHLKDIPRLALNIEFRHFDWWFWTVSTPIFGLAVAFSTVHSYV